MTASSAGCLQVYGKSTCSKCSRTIELLNMLGVAYDYREYSDRPLTAAEIHQIIGDRSPLEFINPGRQAYKDRGFDRNPPTAEQALQGILEDNNLLVRPILIRGDRMVLGWDEEAIRELLGRPA